jgi:hypothetical protein
MDEGQPGQTRRRLVMQMTAAAESAESGSDQGNGFDEIRSKRVRTRMHLNSNEIERPKEEEEEEGER